MPAVERGHTVYVAVNDIEKDKITVQWSQQLRTRQEDYYVCNFTSKSGGDSTGAIFIQTSKINDFKAKSQGGDSVTVQVDDSFQYGQASREGEGRFLVFHDKNNKMFQHRFVESVKVKMGNQALRVFNFVGRGEEANQMAEIIKGRFGDYLRNF